MGRRLDKLAKGEDVSGGLGKPMTREPRKKILKDAGWTDADIRFSMERARASFNEDEFEALVREVCKARLASSATYDAFMKMRVRVS
jgi:hypothetical protein